MSNTQQRMNRAADAASGAIEVMDLTQTLAEDAADVVLAPLQIRILAMAGN